MFENKTHKLDESDEKWEGLGGGGGTEIGNWIWQKISDKIK